MLSQETGPVFKDAPLFGSGKVAQELKVEHGFSQLIEWQTDGQARTALMDCVRTVDGARSRTWNA